MTYATLVKCHVEQVCHIYLSPPQVHCHVILQAIIFVLSACADQAELINDMLQGNKSYWVIDLFPNGEENIAQTKYGKALADGGDKCLSPLIEINSFVLAALDKVVWKGSNLTVCGSKVGPIGALNNLLALILFV